MKTTIQFTITLIYGITLLLTYCALATVTHHCQGTVAETRTQQNIFNSPSHLAPVLPPGRRHEASAKEMRRGNALLAVNGVPDQDNVVLTLTS